MEKQSIFKKAFAGRRKYWISGLVAIVVIAALFLTKSDKNGGANTVIVSRGNVTEEVLVTGTAKPFDYVDLAFERSGKVAWLAKDIGDSVYSGEVLASLDNGAEESSLQSAKADLLSTNARYSELVKGSRPEDISVSEAALDKAKQDLINDYGGIADTIGDAYNNADNAVNVKTDPIFSNDQSANPDLTFNISNQQVKNDTVSARITMNDTLKFLKNSLDLSLKNGALNEEKDNALEAARKNLTAVSNFLIKVSAVLDSATNLSETTLSTYKTDVGTGRGNVNTALTAVNDLMETIASQKITVEKAARELTLKKLGATTEVLAQAEAKIEQAEASVKSAEASIRKTIIRSPIDGIVTKQDAKIGEIAAANNPLISVMSADNFKIEAYVPEADSTKLNLDNTAEVTLDAYSNDIIFTAKVVSIDPAERVIDGVSTYKTTFVFTSEPKPIKSGMTANVTVKTKEKQNVLILPQRAVTSKNGGKYVSTIDEKNNIVETKIETGLRGSDGMVEIISGLNEEDRVINYTK